MMVIQLETVTALHTWRLALILMVSTQNPQNDLISEFYTLHDKYGVVKVGIQLLIHCKQS